MEQVLAIEPWSTRLGRLWFRYRSVSPLPFLVPVILLPADFRVTAPALLVGLFLLFLAEGLRLWAVGYAGSATRTRGVSVDQFVHAGPYRYVRNPLYIANVILYTTLGFLFGFSWLTLGIFVYSVIQYSLIVRFEESLLRHTFREAYVRFLEEVPRWIPRLVPYQGSSHEFSLNKALRSERSTLIALGAILLILVLKRFL